MDQQTIDRCVSRRTLRDTTTDDVKRDLIAWMMRLGWMHPSARSLSLIFKLDDETFMDLVVSVDAQTFVPFFVQVKFSGDDGKTETLDIQGMKLDEAKKLLAKLTIKLRLARGL